MSFRDLPMQAKMLRIIFLVSGIALLAAAGEVLLYEQGTYRNRVAHEVDTLAVLYTDLLPATLDFNDAPAARKYLSSLRFYEQISQACVYAANGAVFATFQRAGSEPAVCLKVPDAGSLEVFAGSRFLALRPIVRDGERIGYLFLEYHIPPVYQRLLQYAVMVGIVFLSLLMVSLLATYLLHFYVTRPIRQLAHKAERVATTQDFSIRAQKLGHDELGALTDALNAMLAKTEESIRLRDDFLSIASHELKTPITPIRMQMQLTRMYLEESAVDFSKVREKLIRLTDIGLKEIDRLARLVDSLLDVSRITTGRFVLKREPVQLAEVITDLVERIRPDAEKAHCELRVKTEAGVEVLADRLHLEQAVQNLILNATKYGAGRPIEIEERHADGRAIIAVRDQGIGIVQEDIERIFGRFERAVSLQSFGGLGLGLYITRQIVNAHNGSIGVESKPGKGSTFTIELPLSSH